MTEYLSLNGNAARVAQLIREKEEKRVQERQLNLLYLIVKFLEEQGYPISAEAIFKEAQLSKSTQVCDNIDLETIVEEYTDYYYARFNRHPKFCKKIESSVPANCGNNTVVRKERVNKNNGKNTEESNARKIKPSQKPTNCTSVDELNFGMTVAPIFPFDNPIQPSTKSIIANEYPMNHEKILKPIGNLYPIGSEWREIAEVISREIVLKDLNVRWSDIKGLDYCKEPLKEATVYPIKYPYLFSDKFSPWKGILLYGPPGTGKTMLAKAVATECQCTFFNITSSSIISKWRGDSEKYVRILLDLAHYYSPAIIFIDEIDWVASKQGDTSSNSEPARRFRAELLARLDGLSSVENSSVILLAATNLPWNIDSALLRRLERRIFVDLPDEGSRREILEHYVKKDLHNTKEFLELLKATKEYSCADLKLLCKEAWMMQMQKIWRVLEKQENSLKDIEKDYINDTYYLLDAMKLVHPTLRDANRQYQEWTKSLSSSK